ncbi:uncharacterized protein LOC126803452 [Argentina anserina]|uniref:uncharacterized protein LOC126803452 n=1 Tax=Argentina anserina TaxID=57926 RepID=UPI0021765155|nr:uncharacterized protein LOC126803452 [Potentilla anserina]
MGHTGKNYRHILNKDIVSVVFNILGVYFLKIGWNTPRLKKGLLSKMFPIQPANWTFGEESKSREELCFLCHMGKDSDSLHKNIFNDLRSKVVLLRVKMKLLIQSIMAIRDEISDSKFFIIVDEAHDQSKEQMAIVLRFVDKYGLIREHFFGLVHVSNINIFASRGVIPIQTFYTKLTFIVNIIGASCKRHDEFQVAQAEEIEYLTSIDELETRKELNQIGTLQRAGDTCWSSHYRSIIV